MSDLSIVELRQYTFAPGGRDDMIDIFERHFLTSQETVGAHVIGHFRDLDDPDRFVWLRGFRDMIQRKSALETFYTSEIWLQYRDAVNVNMLDSDNVLLLRPLMGFGKEIDRSGSRRGMRTDGSLVTATIWPLAELVLSDASRMFVDEVVPLLEHAGATVVAAFVTESSENNYPRLPVREGENVLVWLSRHESVESLTAHEAVLEEAMEWQEILQGANQYLSGEPQRLRLAPCTQSLFI